MPQFIGQVIITILQIGEAVAAAAQAIGTTVAFIEGVIGTIAITAATIGLNLALAPGMPQLRAEGAQRTILQAIAPRRRFYGRVKIGGVIVFWETEGTGSNGNMWQIIALAAQEIDEFEEHWLGDNKILELAFAPDEVGGIFAGNVFQAPYNKGGVSHMLIDFRLGTEDQSHYETLAAAPLGWTSDHVGKGIASVLVKHIGAGPENFSKVFPGGMQSYRAVIRAAKVYNPLDNDQDQSDPSTYQWSDNAALVIMDYLTKPRLEGGLGFDYDTYILPALNRWERAIRICDDLVPIKGGGSLQRYRLWGGYEYTQLPKNVIPLMLAPCDGWLKVRDDGAFELQVGKWTNPTVTLTDDVIRDYKLSRGNGMMRTSNVIAAKYVSDVNDYQEVEAQQWRDDEDVALNGEKIKQVDLLWSPNHSQTRRIMKILAARANPDWVGEITTNAYGLNVMSERWINVQISELGIDESFEVTKHTFEPSTGTCVIGIASANKQMYEWDAETEEGTAPAPSQSGGSQVILDPPENVQAFVQRNDNEPTEIVIICDTGGGLLEAEYRVHDSGVDDEDADWFPFDDSGFSSSIVHSGGIEDDVYDVRVNFTNNGVKGLYEYVRNITVDVDDAAPGPPTNLGVSTFELDIHLTWIAPDRGTFTEAHIYRVSGAGQFSDAEIRGVVSGAQKDAMSFDDLGSPNGAFRYWILSADAEDDLSEPAGPIQVQTVIVPI